MAGYVEKNKALIREMLRIFETGDLSNVTVVIDTGLNIGGYDSGDAQESLLVRKGSGSARIPRCN